IRLASPRLKLDGGSCWDPLATLTQLTSLQLYGDILQDGASAIDTHSVMVQTLQLAQLQEISLNTDEQETSIAGAPDHLVPAHNALTSLDLRAPGWTALHIGPDGLKPFRRLQELRLHLPMKELPSELGLLLQLHTLEVTSAVYLRTANDQPMDITAIGSLGDAIQHVAVRHCQLVKVQTSIRALAAKPKLRHVDLTGCTPSACSAGSWVHLTTFLLALTNRPAQGLSSITLLPEFDAPG
ncbi:hypothetical protein WJX84_008510, partial [Apatococcus fuscideae]